MYFTSGKSRAFESLMQGKPGFDRFDNGGCAEHENCNTWGIFGSISGGYPMKRC